MLGGFLGGLANLGTVYGGFQQAQQQDLRNQLQQLQLQNAQAQLQGIQGLPALAATGALNPPQQQTPQLAQPSALPAVNIPQAPSVTPVQSQPLAPPATPTQLASGGPLGLPGIPGAPALGIPGLPGQTGIPSMAPPPSPAGMGGTVSPFGPGTTPTQFGGGGTTISPPLAGLDTATASLGGMGGATASPFGPGTRPDQYGGAGGTTISPLDTTTTFGGLGPGPQQATAQQPATLDVISLADPSRGGGDPRTSGIVQPAGGFGVPPQYADAAARQTADTGAAAQRTGTDTGGGFGQVLQLESGGDWNMGRGAAGEWGPAQIMPDTFRDYARPGEDISDPRTSTAVAQRYYDDLYRASGNDQAAALVGYNRGPEAMRRFQAGGDNLDALRGTRMMPTTAYQRAIIRAGGKGEVTDAVAAAHADMRRNLPAGYDGIGTAGAMRLLQMVPQLPQVAPAMAPSQLAKFIDHAYPGASDLVKGSVFLKVLPMLNEQAKEQTAQAWNQWKYQMEALKFAEDVRHDVAGEQKDRAANWDIYETDQGLVRVSKTTGQFEPISGLTGAHKLGTPPRDPATKYSAEGLTQQWVKEEQAKGHDPTLQEIAKKRQEFGRETSATGALDELEVPESWPGMPQKPPPGVTQRAWSLALDWVKTDRPPAISRASAEFKQVEQAYPIAQQALGIDPTKQYEQGIKYAGERARETSIQRGFGSGIEARNLISLNTVADHIGLFRQYAAALRTHDPQIINRAQQAIMTQVGSPEVIAMALAGTIAGDEVIRLLTTTGGTLADREGIQKLLAPYSSPEQFENAANTLANFTRGRYAPLRQAYARGDKEREQYFDQNMVTPEARSLFTGPQQPIAGETKGAGGASTSGTEAAIASMTRQQIYKFLQDNPEISDTQRASVAKRLSELAAQEGAQQQSRPPSNVAPPVR